MTFEALVDRLTSGFDVTQARAVDVTNERLSDMVTRSGALRAVISLGSTVASQASYSLAANVVKILRVEIAFTDGTLEYEGVANIQDLWDAAAASSTICGNVVAIEADSDSLMTTDNFRLSPVPSESGKTITGLVALRPATLTYTSNTALPIPVNTHKRLLSGAKAELYDDEGRQDESAKHEASFELGVKLLDREVNSRGKGIDGHRMKIRGYDLSRR